jgi:hypothetical protein
MSGEAECPVDAQSGASGCEGAPLAPPSRHELSLIVVVGSLVEEIRLTNRCLLEICNINSMILQQITARTEDDDGDEGNDKAPRYLGDEG